MMSEKIIDTLYRLKTKCLGIDEKLKENLNLSQSEYSLFISMINSRELSVRELSKYSGLSVSRISRIIESLVNKNLIIRIENPNDRRANLLELTKLGNSTLEKIKSHRLLCEKKIAEILSEHESKELKRLLKTVINTL